MVRCSVTICDAAPDDATALVAVWAASADRAGNVPDAAAHAAQEAAAAIARIAADPDQRLLVARVDDQVAGAVHLLRAPVSPVHSDTAVYVMHLQVIEALRRHGVGRALMEATVGWAEEKDTEHVIAAASVASRDANRFMARLGLGQVAVVRGATVPALRAKLPVEPPAAARVGAARNHRTVGAVIAQRRSLRRSQSRSS
jgi:GNAT superfamily N-acetyltransferase